MASLFSTALALLRRVTAPCRFSDLPMPRIVAVGNVVLGGFGSAWGTAPSGDVERPREVLAGDAVACSWTVAPMPVSRLAVGASDAERFACIPRGMDQAVAMITAGMRSLSIMAPVGRFASMWMIAALRTRRQAVTSFPRLARCATAPRRCSYLPMPPSAAVGKVVLGGVRGTRDRGLSGEVQDPRGKLSGNAVACSWTVAPMPVSRLAVGASDAE